MTESFDLASTDWNRGGFAWTWCCLVDFDDFVVYLVCSIYD